MAKTFTIDIDIDGEGVLSSTTKGLKGKACTEASKFLDAMGKVEVDSPTKEMFETERATVTSRN